VAIICRSLLAERLVEHRGQPDTLGFGFTVEKSGDVRE
jgi:hypothetical protein